MEAIVQSPAFIGGIFTILGMLLAGIGFLIKWALSERKAKREAKEAKETKIERTFNEHQEAVLKYLRQITSTLSQLNANQSLLKEACFLSLESTDLQLKELHEKGILNGESKIQRKKIAEFYKRCAKDAVFTELNIKSDYFDSLKRKTDKKIS